MAVRAKGDEVLLCVITHPAAKFPVVDLQVPGRPTHLTSPAISLENPFMKKLILFWVEF